MRTITITAEDMKKRAPREDWAESHIDVTLSARALATGWINCLLAASDNPDRTLLYKTLALEWFDNGVQLIATDGHALFRAWIARTPRDDDDRVRTSWPLLEEVPYRSIIVMDGDGFGASFMRTLLRVAGEHEDAQVHLATSAMDDEAELALGAEFATERLTLRAFGQRIDLQLRQDVYPNWRDARLGIDAAEYVEGLTLATDLLKRIGQLKGVGSVALEFYGEKNHIVFESAVSEPPMRGLLMPMKRDTKPAVEKVSRKPRATQQDWTTEPPPKVDSDGVQEVKAAKEHDLAATGGEGE